MRAKDTTLASWIIVAVWIGGGAWAAWAGDVPDAYTYDIDAFYAVDPATLIYRETTRVDTGGPGPIASGRGGTFWAAAGGGAALFDLRGGKVREVRLGPGRGVTALAEAPDGVLYVARGDRVDTVSAAGEVESWEPSGEGSIFTSVAAGTNEVWVADAGQRMVLRFDRSGRMLGVVGHGEGADSFVVPSAYLDVAAGPGGAWYSANPGRLRVERRGSDGKVSWSFGAASMGLSGFCGCCNPCHFTILESGHFVTSEKGLTRLQAFLPDGSFEGLVAGPDRGSEEPAEVADGGGGRVLVRRPGEGFVRVYERSGEGGR